MNVDELFAATLSGDYDDDEPWKAVRDLQGIASREVLELASGWCRAEDPLKRARGADILAQIGKTAEHPSNVYPEECYSVVSQLAASEGELRPLHSAIYALGHIADARAIALLVRYASSPDPELREAVAYACGNLHSEPVARDTLLKLMADEDADVRDWATFAIGSLSEADFPEIREALAKALDDQDEDVRREAIVGLARREDLRAFPPLISLLKVSADDPLGIEAAESLLRHSSQISDSEPSALLQALSQRFAALKLIALGGSDPDAKSVPRRRFK